MRYFGECSYLGTNYSGWQRQPKAISVQQIIEEVLSKRFQEEISIVGCGRTDAGVHAKQSYFHFDCDNPTVIDSLYDLNNMLPADIGLCNLFEVDKDAHARFDAISRSYHYQITSIKSPF